MGLDVNRDFVRGLKLFASFTEHEIDALMGVLRERPMNPDEPLFRQGQPGRACYIIRDGKIRVTIGQDDAEQELAVLGAGDLFGQVALIDGGRRSANCIAYGTTVLLALDRNEFDLVFRSGSSFAFKFMDVITRILVGQLRGANKRLADVAAKEEAADDPRAASDPEMQSFFKDLAVRTDSFRADDFDLDDINVVYSEADKARQG